MRGRRGASLVEYLILVGCALVVVLGAGALFARELAAQFDEEGRCLTSGECGPSGPVAGSSGGLAPGVTPDERAASLGTPTPGAGGGGAPQPEPPGLWQQVGAGLRTAGGATASFGKGVVVDGLWGTVTGTWELGKALVTDPVGTTQGVATGIGTAVMNPGETLGNVRDAFVEQWNEDPARALGNAVFQVASTFVPASKAGLVGKVGRVADDLPTGVARRPHGELIGEGNFSRAFADGDHVLKEIKDEFLHDGRMYPLDAAGRRRLAEVTAEWTNRAADELGDVVPRVEVVSDGVIRQKRVEGLRVDELPWDARIDAAERMQDMMNKLEGRIGEQLLDGWSVSVDRNPANFRFDEAGNITSWFDPIAIWPP